MKYFLLLAFAFSNVNAHSSCIPTVTTVPVQHSIQTAISEAEYKADDILTIGSIISTAELSSPVLSYAESVLESYAHSYYSLIHSIETYYASPSIFPASALSEYTRLTNAHSTLASAISVIVSFEETHPSLATAQSALLPVERTQPTILTDLAEYTEVASPSIYTASEIVAEATLTSPSIVASLIAIYTADVAYPSVQSALCSLSSDVFSLPQPVVSEVLTIIGSPSIAPPSVVSSLESCYSSVYSALTLVTAFTSDHESVVPAITSFLSVASKVSSLSTAVHNLINAQMHTLTYDINIISHITDTWPSVFTDMQIISADIATSPTLSSALNTIEQSFYNSPSIATSIFSALKSPSTVTNPKQISVFERSHASLVSAIDKVFGWESAHKSKGESLESIFSRIKSEFKDYRTLLTAASYISAAASPSVASASFALSSLKSVVPDITSVLNYITSDINVLPSLSCDESVIASYAEASPTVVLNIFNAMQNPSEIDKHTKYYEQLTASHPTLADAIENVIDDEVSHPSLSIKEKYFIDAATIDSSILSQYTHFSKLRQSLSETVKKPHHGLAKDE